MNDEALANQAAPSLALRVTARAELAWARSLRTDMSPVNAVLFTARGVVAPLIDVQVSDAGPLASVMLSVDGQEIGRVSEDEPVESIASLLAEHAHKLVGAALAEQYIYRLESRMPALASAVRREFSTQALVDLLRARLREGQSIRDLGGVLTEALIEDPKAST